MTLPRHTTLPPRRRVVTYDLLDPASAWALDEYAITLPVAAEPYDWTLEDDAPQPPQFIPVSPPNWDSPAMPPQAKRKAGLTEAALLIPVKSISPGKRAGKNRARPQRKHLVSSVLMLLLSVMALFVFAYITQKYGR